MNYKNIFQELLDIKIRDGSYRYFNYLSNKNKFPIVNIENKNVIHFCSNDYLGMSVNKDISKFIIDYIQQFGVGAGGTRNIGGSYNIHKELEDIVSKLHKMESSLVFNSAYNANVTALSTIGSNIKDMVFISDEYNHASIIDGIKLSGAEKRIFKHNNLTDLENIISSYSLNKPKIIVFESVYSMNGNIANISEIIHIAKKYNAITYIDEVHAVGLYGKNAAGICERDNCKIYPDIINGTFAKGFGSIGGYISGSKEIVDFIRSYGRGFIFTTSLPPFICKGIYESINFVSKNQELRQKFFNNVDLLRKNFDKYKIKYNKNSTHITTISIGDSIKCKNISDDLLAKYNIYIQPINYPTVKQGEELLRITISPLHTEEHIKALCVALNELI